MFFLILIFDAGLQIDYLRIEAEKWMHLFGENFKMFFVTFPLKYTMRQQ